MDEMAYMMYAKDVNRAISSSTPCRFFVSTPNGENNEYYKMRILALQGKIKYIKFNWYDMPFYDQAWFDWKQSTTDEATFAQEVLINYNVAIVGRVYPQFKEPLVQFGDDQSFDYDYSLPLFVSIDHSHGGITQEKESDPHFVIVSQLEPN